MPPRTIDGPGEGRLVTTEEAARWLSVHEDTLEALAAKEDWLHPVKIGRKKLWRWLDIVALAVVIEGRAGAKKEE
jgi:hypothetical protein